MDYSANTGSDGPPAPYRLLRGARPDAPLLLPLANAGADLRALIQFCRRICPGAPILALHIEQIEGACLGRIEAALAAALSAHGLALLPVVAIGHGEGADLAARLALSCGRLLAAGLLLRPRRMPTVTASHEASGLCVLLCTSPGMAQAGTARLRSTLLGAGAQVVSERVPRRQSPGGGDTALCRVFLAALFGPHAPQ